MEKKITALGLTCYKRKETLYPCHHNQCVSVCVSVCFKVMIIKTKKNQHISIFSLFEYLRTDLAVVVGLALQFPGIERR